MCFQWSDGEIEMSVGGHARLQFMIEIVDIDLDSINKRDSLLICLNALGSELGVRGNEGDAPVLLLPRVGVGGDVCVLAPVNTAEIGFGNVCAQPYVIEIGDGDHRSSGRNHFAELSLADRNDA